MMLREDAVRLQGAIRPFRHHPRCRIRRARFARSNTSTAR
jgi:hypothetical protein